MRLFQNYIFIFIFTFFKTHAFAQDTRYIVLKDDRIQIDIDGRSLEFFEDISGKLDLKDILKNNKNFKKGRSKVLAYGFSKSSIWIKLKVKNKSSIKDWMLSINFPDLDELILYKRKNGKWIKGYAGDSVSTKKWENIYKDYIFNLDGEETYYLKVRSRGALSIPLKVITKESFQNEKKKNNFFF